MARGFGEKGKGILSTGVDRAGDDEHGEIGEGRSGGFRGFFLGEINGGGLALWTRGVFFSLAFVVPPFVFTSCGL